MRVAPVPLEGDVGEALSTTKKKKAQAKKKKANADQECLVLGLAGSGKTLLIRRLKHHFQKPAGGPSSSSKKTTSHFSTDVVPTVRHREREREREEEARERKHTTRGEACDVQAQRLPCELTSLLLCLVNFGECSFLVLVSCLAVLDRSERGHGEAPEENLDAAGSRRDDETAVVDLLRGVLCFALLRGLVRGDCPGFLCR